MPDVLVGVLSDLHCELEPTGSRWINVFEPEQLDRRTDAALAWFSEAEVDLILLLGDACSSRTRVISLTSSAGSRRPTLHPWRP